MWWSHTVDEYSKSGLTRVVYVVVFDVGGA